MVVRTWLYTNECEKENKDENSVYKEEKAFFCKLYYTRKSMSKCIDKKKCIEIAIPRNDRKEGELDLDTFITNLDLLLCESKIANVVPSIILL